MTIRSVNVMASFEDENADDDGTADWMTDIWIDGRVTSHYVVVRMQDTEQDRTIETSVRITDVIPPAMLELCGLVAQEYPDAADWKDARSKLSGLAHSALAAVASDHGRAREE